MKFSEQRSDMISLSLLQDKSCSTVAKNVLKQFGHHVGFVMILSVIVLIWLKHNAVDMLC